MGGIFRCFLLAQQHGKIFRLCQHIGHTLGAGLALGPHDEDPGDTQHGVEDVSKILQESHDDAAFHLAGIHPGSAQHHRQGQAQIQHQRGNGVGDAGDGTGLQGDIRQVVIDLVKPLFLVIGLTQRLDDPDTGDVFLHGANHVIQHILLMEVHGHAELGHKVGHDGDDGKQANKDQRQLGIHAQHQHHAADQQHGGTDAHPLESGQQLIDVVGVAGEPGNGGGDGQLVHLFGRQTLQLGEQIVTNGLGDAAGALSRHSVGKDIEAQCQCRAEDHQAAVDKNSGTVTLRHLDVHHDLHEVGDQQLHHGAKQLDKGGQQDKAPIGADIPFQFRQINAPPSIPMLYPAFAAGRNAPGLLPCPTGQPAGNPPTY